MSLKRSNSDIQENSNKKVKPEITLDYLNEKFHQYFPLMRQYSNKKIYSMWTDDDEGKISFGISGESIEEIDKFIEHAGIDIPEEYIVKQPFNSFIYL